MKSSLPVGIVLILAAACARLFPHPPNVTPVVAIALAGGIYMGRAMRFIVPLAALLLSDFVLGFHGLMLYVYGSVVLTVVLGMAVGQKKNLLTIGAGSLCSSLLFFLITNAGVWIQDGGQVYPATIDGLLLSYTMGIPFFRNAIFGDLSFVLLMSALFELSMRLHLSSDRTTERDS